MKIKDLKKKQEELDNIKDLKQKQEELDEEIIKCPKCGNEDRWGFYREYGDCGWCVAEYMEKQERKNRDLDKEAEKDNIKE